MNKSSSSYIFEVLIFCEQCSCADNILSPGNKSHSSNIFEVLNFLKANCHETFRISKGFGAKGTFCSGTYLLLMVGSNVSG